MKRRLKLFAKKKSSMKQARPQTQTQTPTNALTNGQEIGSFKSMMRTTAGPMDSVLLLLVLILVTFGLIMVFSASYVYAEYYMGNSFHYIQRQALFALMGLIAMLILSRIPYFVYQKLARPIFIIVLALNALVFPLNGFETGRHIYIAGQQFQPSELLKVALIIFFAMLIQQNQAKIGTALYGIRPFFVTLVPIVLILIVFQHHLSATVIVCAIALAMMFVGGSRLRYFVPLVGVGILGVAGIIMVRGVDYMVARIDTWLNPMDDMLGDGWQISQSLIAIGSGGLMGKGLGNSTQKYLYLPEPQNDFIFAIICEELGFIGAMLIIALFVLLACRGFMIANRAPNLFSSMLVMGIVFHISLQTIFNIGVVSAAIPNTGISLPFFSYGGTALLIQMAEIGIVLNVSRYASEEKI